MLCRPIFAELAKLAAHYSPEASAAITYVPAAKVRGGASPGSESPAQYLYV